MNINEALKILGVDSISESEEALENKLFEIKQEIIANCHVPQLIVAKQKKLRQLITISEILNFNIQKRETNFEIEELETDSILDSFNLYHKNRALIMREILALESLNVLIFCTDLLLENLKNWAEKWPILQANQMTEIKLSKELESVEMYRLIEELNENKKLFFNDLKTVNLPNPLFIEIQRLNLIATYFATRK
jgi:hypothetical protein